MHKLRGQTLKEDCIAARLVIGTDFFGSVTKGYITSVFVIEFLGYSLQIFDA